ncbi:hypothetical protein BDP81DRAFT_405022 [Colletotrichum phormii]|uniref:Uncharacterized protein n=1 Tax=Colletotrichum phormii TaxID=359342 RepID=A0AAI9ZWL4_9PEZI|nr:uncharacterized protein BDP81DRAFT_405022 [Colletotrichum phormii]KAK1639165.1 hypothetical protein BDP81DRAFT_405022 [Colletotrichum phormii]
MSTASTMFFCSSLRQRPEWSPIYHTFLCILLPSAFTFTDGRENNKESRLDTHDIALPISQNRTYRFILLSPKDVGQRATEKRLERLYSLDGGRNIAVIFLIGEVADQSDAMQAFMEFKIDLMEKKLDLLPVPLTSHMELPSTLACVREMLAAVLPAFEPVFDSSLFLSLTPNLSVALIQYMAGSNEPLSEHSANLLSELGQSPREIAALADTEEGRVRILDVLGPQDGQAVLGFLALERLAYT